MENIILTLLLVLTSIFSAVGTNPGIVIRVNNQGLAYGKLIICRVNNIAYERLGIWLKHEQTYVRQPSYSLLRF
jgi:hypothetical protein